MNEFIRKILQALGKDASDERVSELSESMGLVDTDSDDPEDFVGPLADALDISKEAIRNAAELSEDTHISADPEQTMRTLEDLTTPREGQPYIATTNRISRSADEQRTTVVINTDTQDRHGTIIDPEGGNLENYKKNPVFLINHSYSLPAGNNSRVRMQNQQIIAEVSDEDWNDDESTEKGREIKFWKDLVKEGKVKMASVGIMPLEIKREEREDPKTGDVEEKVIISKWELLEWSFVPVGSNPEALVMQRNMSLAGQDPTKMAERLNEVEEAINEIRDFKDSLQNIEVLLGSDKLKRALEQFSNSNTDGGQAERGSSNSDGSSDDENRSEADDVPYVEPPKKRKAKSYVPKPQGVDPDKMARSIHDKIKRKQGKR